MIVRGVPILLIIVTVAVTGVFAQAPGLKGQYTFEKKNEMSSMFVFADDGVSFVAFRAGDLASTYGEGKFELQGTRLILHYDSTGVKKRVSRKHIITPTGTDTLTLRNVTARKFELVLDPSGHVETYRKLNDPLAKKRR
jgi:hypothetical protein